jgi:hypothetical protein
MVILIKIIDFFFNKSPNIIFLKICFPTFESTAERGSSKIINLHSSFFFNENKLL